MAHNLSFFPSTNKMTLLSFLLFRLIALSGFNFCFYLPHSENWKSCLPVESDAVEIESVMAHNLYTDFRLLQLLKIREKNNIFGTINNLFHV